MTEFLKQDNTDKMFSGTKSEKINFGKYLKQYKNWELTPDEGNKKSKIAILLFFNWKK